jgi:dTDP-4-amino-4,6-dideoxy-D-galactose acyltransferase
MITCRFNDQSCNIGLVAVGESEQGKGTGKNLLKKVEIEAYKRKLSEILVPTQFNNEIACRFYETAGFQPIEITNYYHFWTS